MYEGIFGVASIHSGSFVCNPENLIGSVIIEQEVFVAPMAVIRADECGPFRICRGTNIQDLAILHGLADHYVVVDGHRYSIYIGSHCSITHRALIHGPCKIGKKTFVGFSAIVYHSNIGVHCHIGLGAIVRDVTIADGRYVEDGLVVNSQKVADSLPPNKSENGDFNRKVVDCNKKLFRKYKSATETIKSQTPDI